MKGNLDLLLLRAKQFQLEQETINKTEDSNYSGISILKGINRIVDLIERHIEEEKNKEEKYNKFIEYIMNSWTPKGNNAIDKLINDYLDNLNKE